MARTKALSLLQAAGTKADLKEIYGIVIDNIQKDTLSSGLKSQAYTGNPAAGSVEFRDLLTRHLRTMAQLGRRRKATQSQHRQ